MQVELTYSVNLHVSKCLVISASILAEMIHMSKEWANEQISNIFIYTLSDTNRTTSLQLFDVAIQYLDIRVYRKG